MKELYYSEVLNESYNELINFSKWMNKIHGFYPVIVGGWAVYAYTKGLGSRDIDVVFPSAGIMHSVLIKYFKYNDYERVKSFMTESFSKKLNIRGKEEEIIIDACTKNNISISKGTNVRIPWGWTHKYNQLHELKKNTFIYIPEIELLLAMKVKASIDRTIALEMEIQESQVDYYKSKIWKDYYDIASLLKLNFDNKKFHDFVKESHLDNFLKRSSETIESYGDIIESLGIKKQELKKLKL